jgi:hypothetical protein
MTQAGFILGDLDFEPLLFSLNRFGIETTVFYERETASEELLEAADVRNQLTLATFYTISDDAFQRVAPRVYVQESVGRPDFPVIRRGRWNGRSIQLLRPEGPTNVFHIWLEPGPEGFVR